MSAALLEPTAIEVERPELAAPHVLEIRPANKITDIAQLPPIWRLEQNTEWLIDGIIRLGSITLLSGESGGGKTWLAYAIAGAVARGWAFADLKVQQRPTLYLDGENPLCVAKQRLFDLGIPETNGLQVWGRWVGDPPPGPDSAIIREFVQRHRPLLIWDSLIDFHDGDEQSASETRKFMKQFRATGTSRRDCSHSAPHRQNPTSQDYRGSSDIKAAVDMAYCLELDW